MRHAGAFRGGVFHFDLMSQTSVSIPGYSFGMAEVGLSPISLRELEELKVTAAFTDEDARYLQLAGLALEGQTRQVVEHWRSHVIASIPHLARHSRTPEGAAIPEYLARSNRRFEQWILDTCQRPYDQDWINYQHEIALRHTSARKNKVDGVRSTPFAPLGDIIAFAAVMNETIKPYLAAKGNSADEVEKMHRAWCKSMHIQLALWTAAYADPVRSAFGW